MPQTSQKGTTLYFAIIIMSILLAAVLSIGTVVLIQLKVIKEMGDSIIAYYAADSGAEAALYQGKTGIPPAPWPAGNLGEASYETTFLATTSPDCNNARWYCIESKGFYRESERRVKITR